MRCERGLQLGLLLTRERGVHEAVDRTADDREGGTYDVQRHEQCDHRIDPLQVRERRERHAHDHRGRRPHVGEQVMRVGLERDRVIALAGAHEHDCHAQVHEAREHRHREADADLLEPLDRVREALQETMKVAA